MIQAALLNLEVWREANFSDDDWQLTDPTTSPASPISITGYAFSFLVAQQEGALSAPLINIKSESNIGDRVLITDAANGKFRPLISAATIAALPLAPSGDSSKPGTRLFCALIATPPGGVAQVYAAGAFIVRG